MGKQGQTGAFYLGISFRHFI